MINIALCFDDNYLPMAKAVCKSILTHHDVSEVTFFFVVNIQSSNALNDFEQHLNENKVSFHLHNINLANYGSLETKGHISHAAFLRLEIASLFPEESKMLYLDSDLIVTGRLDELWNISLTTHPLAAAANTGKNGSVRLGLNHSHIYFNSGVVVFDLNYFRDNNIAKKAFDWLLTNNKERAFHDQDALNVCYENKCELLPIRYNIQAFYLRHFFKLEPDVRSNIIAALRNPVIFHFSSGRKPWQSGDQHPYKQEFLRYYDGEIKHDENSLFEYVKRAYLFIYYSAVRLSIKLAKQA